MLEATVYYTKSDHLTRIMTGFHLLEMKGVLRCTYIEDKQHNVLPDSASVLELRLEGKRIAFDLRDASALFQSKNRNYLRSVDMYFERSHIDWSTHPEIKEYAHKIHPFGFNYFTTCPGNPALERSHSKNSIKNLLRDVFNSPRFSGTEVFEGKAAFPSGNRKIIFMTRLWDPADIRIKPEHTEEERLYRLKMMEERETINADRIKICRELKKRYGSRFCGGIQRSALAMSLCPDLVLPAYMTLKPRYIKLMKSSDICIGSAGLEKSIGWKTGEYVAAARAIVCEEPAYILPGDFEQGKNYLSYSNADECLAAVKKLYDNPDLIYQMQKANERYYRQYLRPEVQILNALEKSGIMISQE